MIVFPNCKINLGLHIVGKRADGFHNLETIFYPLPLKDVVEILPHPQGAESIEFSCSGLVVDGSTNDNICVKAYLLLKQNFPHLPQVKMHLLKNIPTGAGLGGGSADGAFVLSTLNKMFHLQLSQTQLIEYGLQLGSDCPFFIYNQPCFATSRGEVLEPLSLDLSPYKVVILNTGIHINTGWAFSQIRPKASTLQLKEAATLPIQEWNKVMMNDFETPVFEAYPQLLSLKESMYQKGALYASMSGSGSTIFGLFSKNQVIDWQWNKDWLQKEINL